MTYVSGHVSDRPTFAGRFILAAGLLLLLAWLAGVVAGPTPREGTIEFEYRKYLMQFLMIGAVGAVVKYIVEDTTRKRDERLSRLSNATQRAGEFLTSLSATYSDVKDIRISLDLVGRAELRKPEYMDAMWRARCAQQALERLKGSGRGA